MFVKVLSEGEVRETLTCLIFNVKLELAKEKFPLLS